MVILWDENVLVILDEGVARIFGKKLEGIGGSKKMVDERDLIVVV